MLRAATLCCCCHMLALPLPTMEAWFSVSVGAILDGGGSNMVVESLLGLVVVLFVVFVA